MNEVQAWTELLKRVDGIDDREMAIEHYLGMVLSTYEKGGVFVNEFGREQMQGSELTAPVMGEVDAYEHTRMADEQGTGNPEMDKRSVPLDRKILRSREFVALEDLLPSHFNPLDRMAMLCSAAVSRKQNQRTAMKLAQGARQKAKGTNNQFESGICLPVIQGASDVKLAFPTTLSGSLKFQDILDQAGEEFQHRDVPEELTDWVCFIDPYMNRVLLKDKNLSRSEFTGAQGAGVGKHVVDYVGQFRIVVTPYLSDPAKSRRSIKQNLTTGEAAYQGNYSKTLALFSAGPEAALVAGFNDITAQPPQWDEDKLAWKMGAYSYGGINHWRHEICGEIYVAPSEYVPNETTGVLEPAA